MLVSLKLTNFRKHEDRTFNFTPGLNIIRGENEAGKTTINEAIGYAKFGSSALRESLEDVVTYDKPLNSLRVELVELIDGVEYRTSRGKSGAEILYADQRVTGQTETKKFFENMLGCTAATFGQLALASQGDVRGVLTEGPTATNGLVETLAQLSVVETIIDKVQNQLPSGNTGALAKQIQDIEVGEEPVKPAFEDVSDKEAKIAEIAQKIGSANDRLPPANKLAIAEATLKMASDLSRDYQKQVERNNRLTETLVAPADPGVTEGDLAKAREAVANSVEEERKRKAYATKFTIGQTLWDDSEESLEVRLAEIADKIGSKLSHIAEINGRLVTLRKALIKSGTVCPTCKQELPDAASIEKHNAEHQQSIAEDEKQQAQVTKEHDDLAAERKTLLEIQRIQQHNKTLLGNYWTLDSSKQVPGIPVWKGEPPAPEAPLPDVVAMEKKLKDYDKAVTIYEQAQATLAEPLPVVPDVTEETLLMATAEAVRKELVELGKQQTLAESELQQVSSRNSLKQLGYERDVQAYEKAREHKKALQTTLAEMTKHNDLIKKLRSARPVIATELWGIVLGAVSHYTTSIRGEASLITKDADGFKISGRKVSGLSGSGQDALGLAVRISLSKTFLPNLPFIMLDEAFAACDDSREVNGLGTLAAAGFAQTLLVTHSDLGDSLADNLIQL